MSLFTLIGVGRFGWLSNGLLQYSAFGLGVVAFALHTTVFESAVVSSALTLVVLKTETKGLVLSFGWRHFRHSYSLKTQFGERVSPRNVPSLLQSTKLLIICSEGCIAM